MRRILWPNMDSWTYLTISHFREDVHEHAKLSPVGRNDTTTTTTTTSTTTISITSITSATSTSTTHTTPTPTPTK